MCKFRKFLNFQENYDFAMKLSIQPHKVNYLYY